MTYRQAALRYRPSLRMSVAMFAWTPFVVTVGLLLYLQRHGQLAFDFSREYRVVGARLLHGADPYAWSRTQILNETAFAYPAAAALLMVPFALIPAWLGAGLFVAGCMACVAGALWVLGVRDWRLYGLVMLWSVVVAGWQSANLTLPLVFSLALLWRYRDARFAAGLIAAAMVSLKPFLWPVLLWLLVTRRYRAAAWSLVAGVAINLVAWWVVGFSLLGPYVRLAGHVTDLLYRNSYGIMALAGQAGASRSTAQAALVIASAAIAGGCLKAGRADDWSALTLCILLALTASPLVDTHYFAFIVVPLAVRRPRLSVEWFMPLALWRCPESTTAGWQAVVAWLTVISTVLISRPARSRTLSDSKPSSLAPGQSSPQARSPIANFVR